MPDFSAFEKSTQDRTSRAAQMRRDLLLPILDANGSFRSDISREELNTTFKTASQNSVYESAGEQAPMIMGIHARALKNFIEQHGGTLPSDELLASAHQAIENFMTLGRGKPALSGVFEDAGKEMSSTEGIIMRDRMVSLILPVLLNSITPNMVTLLPGQFNQSEFFRIKRIGGSKFGDLQKGDIIDYTYNGQYAVMDQMFKAGDGDGTTTKFSFDSKTAFGTVYPLKRKRIMVLHDHNVVASDDAGSVMGAFRLGGEMVNVTGTVDYATGKVDVTFSKAPAIGVEVHIGYDVDIEKDPTLIPRIDHEMDSRTLYPHEAAIAGDSTIQAQWGLRREYGLDIDNMTLAGMRNLLAADKDRKILRQMLFYAKGVTEWCYEGPESLTLQEHYETLKAALLEIDTRLTQRTGVVGLTGIVGDTQSVNIFRYLPSPFFTPAPGYRPSPQPHYVGKIFGQYDLYCNPSQEPYTSLCYAKGPEHGQTGFVAGDAVPAITFRHPVLTDLMSRSTLWELSYRNLQPFDGREYLTTLKIVPKMGA